VDGRAPAGKTRSDPRRWLGGLGARDLALAGPEQRRAPVLVGDRRLLDERQTQRVAVEPIRVLEPIHDDADVVNASHHALPPQRMNGATLQEDASRIRTR